MGGCCTAQQGGKHTTNNYHLLQKYTQMSQQLFCNLCRSVGHDKRTCQSYELMMDQTPACRLQTETRALNPNERMTHVGFQGHIWGWGGMGLGRGLNQIICYNWEGPELYACDCTNLTRISCCYYNRFDREVEDFPSLIAKMHEKGVLQPPPTHNLKMMRSEPHK